MLLYNWLVIDHRESQNAVITSWHAWLHLVCYFWFLTHFKLIFLIYQTHGNMGSNFLNELLNGAMPWQFLLSFTLGPVIRKTISSGCYTENFCILKLFSLRGSGKLSGKIEQNKTYGKKKYKSRWEIHNQLWVSQVMPLFNGLLT